MNIPGKKAKTEDRRSPRVESSIRERLKHLLSADYENSVFRRTFLLIAFIFPASLLNFIVLYSLSALLTPPEFGVFYVANTMGNVLFSGALILNMFFVRHFVAAASVSGEDAALVTVDLVGRAVIKWGALLGVVVLAGLLLFSSQLGVQSLSILPLITLDAYTSYVADTGRAYFQSVRRTLWLGIYTLTWVGFRLVLCLAAVFIFRTAFAVFAALVLSTVLAYVGFYLWARRKRSMVSVPALPLPSLKALMPSIFGYGLLTLISNLDVLLSSLILKDASLGVYSASSVYPKSMLVVTLPLIQILFPGMMGSKNTDPGPRRFVLRSAAAMIVITAGSVTTIGLLSGFLCGGRWGLRLCETPLLNILLLSVVPLTLLRLLVLLQFARKHDWFVGWLSIPTVIFLSMAAVKSWNATEMATAFAVFSFAACGFFLFIHVVAERLRNRLWA